MKNKLHIITGAIGILAGYLLTLSFQPTTAQAQAPAQGKFAHVEILLSGGDLVMFDKNTGSLWHYEKRGQAPERIGTLTAPGAPLADVRPLQR